MINAYSTSFNRDAASPCHQCLWPHSPFWPTEFQVSKPHVDFHYLSNSRGFVSLKPADYFFFHFLLFHKRKTLHVSFSRVTGILRESQISLAHWVNWAELLSVSFSQGGSFLLDLWVLPWTLGPQSLSYGKALIYIRQTWNCMSP